MMSNNVRQRCCFIIQGSYIGYMFRLIDQSSSGQFSRLSHKVLCTQWDPSVCTSIKYIKSDRADLVLCIHKICTSIIYIKSDQADLVLCIHKICTSIRYIKSDQADLVLCIHKICTSIRYIKSDQADLVLCIHKIRLI